MELGIIEQFANAIKQEPNEKKSTYSAIVSKVDEEGIIWVYVAGSDKETPTASSTTEVKKGDTVTVEWRNNKLYISGNTSNPSAGSTRVNAVEQAAIIANQAAQNAVDDAGIAREAASSAVETARGIEGIAEDAKTTADNAKNYANETYRHVSVVENIVGVLQLIAEHGSYAPAMEDELVEDKWYFTKESEGVYQLVNNPDSVFHLTSDTTIDSEKQYYRRSGTGTEEDPFVYTLVETPVQSELSTYYEKYYVLVDIDQSIQNYVSSHLVLTQTGLSLRSEKSEYTMDIDTNAVTIKNGNGLPVASYGETAIIGLQNGFHIKLGMNSQGINEIGFYNGTTKLAYINGAELYVMNSLSFGHFTFVERANGHFTLKLMRG